ncbi:MoaD/ThiS family protein [Candidatus Aerophobetes bacterium]|uniref:MoaD/ThiS family protein n=1 Tax=Aerophobetes bacterium TaxID=2030807 RepID=A0A523WCC2_UNCAE|nr:MAG: MoaD/ThiS family protein [Candidatus Aerophobetes bacterium]
MVVKVRIPAPLLKLTNNQVEVDCNGETVSQILEDLGAKFPGIKERICDKEGKVRKFINIYVNEQDVRLLKGEATGVKEGDEVSIIPAIAGG